MVQPMGRQRNALVIAGLGAWLWLRDGSPRTSPEAVPPSLQAAVLADGFAVLDTRTASSATEIDRDGHQRRRTPLSIKGDTRLVGSRAGVTLGYLQREKLELAFIDKAGEVTPSQQFGKNVAKICDGAATNDHRFAIGWMETGGGLWLVHGHVGAKATELLHDGPAVVASSAWCGMRSAGEYVALMWLDRVTVNVLMCSDRECSRFVTPMKIERGAKVLDVACQEGGCVLATRTSTRPLDLTSYNLRGKKLWSRSWHQVDPRADVHLVAAGDRSFALAATTSEVTFVDRILATTGSSQREWVHPHTTSAPALAWSRDQLLLAYRDHGTDALHHRLLAFPP